MIFAAARARSEASEGEKGEVGGVGGGTINKFYAGVWKNRNVTIYDNKM